MAYRKQKADRPHTTPPKPEPLPSPAPRVYAQQPTAPAQTHASAPRAAYSNQPAAPASPAVRAYTPSDSTGSLFAHATVMFPHRQDAAPWSESRAFFDLPEIYSPLLREISESEHKGNLSLNLVDHVAGSEYLVQIGLREGDEFVVFRPGTNTHYISAGASLESAVSAELAPWGDRGAVFDVFLNGRLHQPAAYSGPK